MVYDPPIKKYCFWKFIGFFYSLSHKLVKLIFVTDSNALKKDKNFTLRGDSNPGHLLKHSQSIQDSNFRVIDFI